MSGKINLLFLLLLTGLLIWQWLGPQRRKEAHRTVQIAAKVLIATALLAILFHQYATGVFTQG
ncbi:hypothetical protein NT239_11125 [Chitinibacter sp. SCUT-21]|uniref:protein MIGRI n=1 Tax=Chitinibacter sp. SCUT-21 TaxID=2970891 RepID=UPI0035A5C4B1